MLKSAVSGQGSFEVIRSQWENEPNHCGIDVQTIKWKAHIVGALNPRGFVIDVRTLHGYFKHRFVTKREALPSCENIAQQAALYFSKHAVGCERVRVSVQASALGFATAEWTRDATPLL